MKTINETTVEEIRRYASDNLSGKRFAHSLGVEAEAVFMAETLGLGDSKTNQLRAAALLHDITKEWSDERQIRYCRERNIPTSVPDRAGPTLHAHTGAYFAKDLFPDIVTDPVFSAIYYHTTGKADMSLEEKIICLSDFIEPGRKYESCVAVRQRFHENITADNAAEKIDECLLGSFDMTIISLIKRGVPIDKDTFDARNFLIEKRSDKTL